MSRLTARRPGIPDQVWHSDPQDPPPYGISYQFMLDGAGLDFGDPEPVIQTIDELIGSLQEIDRWNNRPVGFYLQITAPDGDALAQGEAAVVAMLADRFELVWEPFSPYAKATSFWIEPGSRMPRVTAPSGLPEFFEETSQLRRTYQLQLTARPFALAAEPTVTSWALTGTQGSHQVPVGGIAPANCALNVSAASGLGSVIAHVARTPLAYTPALRSRMTSSTATLARPGVPAFAGSTWVEFNNCTFDIPANTLPEGPYELLAHLHTEVANLDTLVTWTAEGRDGGYAIGPSESGSVTMKFTGTEDQMVPLGRLALPVQGSTSPTAFVRITISSTTALYVDEAWLLWIAKNDAALLRGELGTGTPTMGSSYSRLEAQAPTVVEPKQRLMVGVGATAPVRAGLLMPVRDRLAMRQGDVQVYVGCTGAAGATVDFSVWEAFHSHVVGAAS